MYKKVTVLLLSPLPPPEGGIASWTKHMLYYYNEISENSQVQLFHFSTAKRKGRITDKRLFARVTNGVYNSIQILWGIQKAIKEIKPDIIHVTSSASWALLKDYIIVKIAKRHKSASIVHFRFGRIPQLARINNCEWKLLKEVVRQSAKAIVIDKRSLKTMLVAGFNNVEYLPNPISPEILEIIDNKKQLNSNTHDRKVVFVGHVLEAKGVYELVDACMAIPGVSLEIIGPYEEKIKNKLLTIATKTKEASWLKFSGSRESSYIVNAMLSANVFCLPSYTEGFPNVILESMACGCPIVASLVGAIPEMLNADDENCKCGTCVEPQNVRELEKAISLYLSNKSLASNHGNKARERVLLEYNMASVWKDLSEIWILTSFKNDGKN